MRSLTLTPRPSDRDNSNNNPKIAPPRDWIIGQQVGILAYALTQFDRRQHSAQKEVRIRCQDLLQNKLNEFRECQGNLRFLPTSSLHLLSQPELKENLPRYLRSQHDQWRVSYVEVTDYRWSRNGQPRPSQAIAAQLIAHQILFTDARAEAIASASEAFLAHRFGDFQPDDIARVRAPLIQVRNAHAQSRRIVEAINKLTTIFCSYGQSGILIRNALLDLIFTWPILVFGQSEANPIGALSVPIAVDISFTGQNDVVIRPDQFRMAAPTTTTAEWKAELVKAANIGKALWRSKNGNAGKWRDRVLGARMIFDFGVAEDVLEGLGLRVSFCDRSMGPYYSQVVLAKAAGKHVGFTTAVTGLIAEQRSALNDRQSSRPVAAKDTTGVSHSKDGSTDELDMPPAVEQNHLLDWRFTWASRVREKKRYVYGSYKFDRLVLPPDTQPQGLPGATELSNDHYVETNHCRYLSGVADCVQIGGWRQFKYIRCPDIAHTMHRHFAELPYFDTPAVAKCTTLLRDCQGPILNLPEDCSTDVLCSALRQINFVTRLSDPRPAPTLSWAVIRTTEEEMQTRFWHQVWRAVGASRRLFNRFRLTRTVEEAASLLAHVLNRLEPNDQDRGERAPDLLIIVGTKNLTMAPTEKNSQDIHSLRPHSFDLVMDVLSKLDISPVRDHRLTTLIGSTRIITVQENKFVGHGAPPMATLFEEDREIVQCLRTYRFGFTQQMASMVLGKKISAAVNVRELLERLRLANFLTYGNGWFRLRSLQESDFAEFQINDPKVLANYHHDAAFGFAPYLSMVRIPGLNIAHSLLPENVREAQWHFKQAAYFGRRAHQRDIVRQSMWALERITRFFEIRTWGVVTELSKRRSYMPHNDTYEIAKALLSELAENDIIPRPTELIMAAQSAARFLEDLIERKSEMAITEALKEETKALFEHACVSAEDSRFGKEIALHVWMRFASFLHRRGTSEEELKRRDSLDLAITKELQRGSQALWPDGEWFECHADRLEDHKSALHYYKLGQTFTPGDSRIQIKAIGTGVLCDESSSSLLGSIENLGKERVRALRDFAINQEKFANRLEEAWVPSRWAAGKTFFQNQFST